MFQAFYIYVYAVGLLFFIFCFAFLLRNYSCHRSKAIIIEGANRRDNLYQSPSETSRTTNNSSTITQRKLSMTRKVTHSAQNAGSLYLRLGAVSKNLKHIFFSFAR